MSTISKNAEEKQQEQLQQTQNGYWRNELYSLGIVDPKQMKNKEHNNDDDEDEKLEKLADIIKQAMFQDYKIAYSKKGDI